MRERLRPPAVPVGDYFETNCLRTLIAIRHANLEGKSPSIRELCDLLGLGSNQPNAIRWMLNVLKRHGLITFQANRARTAVATCRIEVIK